ncbi:MAG: hypothetical protein R2716_13685 [Microthrixaceae bacterium]
MVTADGKVRVANRYRNRSVLRCEAVVAHLRDSGVDYPAGTPHPHPTLTGARSADPSPLILSTPTRSWFVATSEFYPGALNNNPSWGEQVRFNDDNTVDSPSRGWTWTEAEARAVWAWMPTRCAAPGTGFEVDVELTEIPFGTSGT